MILPTFAVEVTEKLEPRKVVLLGDTDKFESTVIETEEKDVQNVQLEVFDEVHTEELSEVTNIIVDKCSYDGMNKANKRQLVGTLEEELENNKEIIIMGDEDVIHLNNLGEVVGETLDVQIEKLNNKTNLFATSLKIDSEGNKIISLFNTNQENIDNDTKLKNLFDIQNSEFSEDEFADSKNIKTQKLATNAVANSQKVVDYNVYTRNGTTKEAIIRTVMNIKRVAVANPKSKGTISTWESKIDLDINPQNNYQVSKVGASMRAGNSNDEQRLKSWPTTTVGSGSHSYSFGAEVASGGVSANAGYSYSVNYTDINLVTELVDGNINNYYWGFTYNNGSNPARYSSALDVGARYSNAKGNFTLQTETAVVMANSRYNTGSYRFSIADISVK